MSLIDHIAIGVGDLKAARTFYLTALAPLGPPAAPLRELADFVVARDR